MNYDVSIIIPVFNTEPYLENCIKSLLVDKNIEKYEIIIINDKSPGNTCQIINRFTDQYPNIKYIKNKKNMGLGASRNLGIKASRGDYIFFLDSDDEVYPNAISCLFGKAKNEEATLTTGKITRANLNGILFTSKLSKNVHIKNFLITSLKDHPALIWDTSACNKLYSKKFLKEINFLFPEKLFFEEIFPVTRALALSKRIAILDSPIYQWNIRESGESITQQTKSLKNLNHRFIAIRKTHALINDARLKEEFYSKVFSHDLYKYTKSLHRSNNEFQTTFRDYVQEFSRYYDYINSDTVGLKTKILYSFLNNSKNPFINIENSNKSVGQKAFWAKIFLKNPLIFTKATLEVLLNKITSVFQNKKPKELSPKLLQ